MTGQPSKIKSAAYGGLALGAASAMPFLNILNCACCSLVMLGGFLASYLYLKGAPPPPGSPPPYGDVALVGLLAGVFGAVVNAILSLPIMMLGMGQGMWSVIQEQLQSTELPEPLSGLLATAGAGTFAAGMVLFSLVFNLFVFGLFATVGALIGAAVLHRTPPPAATPPPPVMPPPPLPPAAA